VILSGSLILLKILKGTYVLCVLVFYKNKGSILFLVTLTLGLSSLSYLGVDELIQV
jgi:predicted Zn-dependent protease